MLQRIRTRLTYANVISTACLFILLGGGAYAATKLPKNSVGTAQLKKSAVTGAKVKDGSLSGSDIDLATLGTVPSASSSGSANTAQTANRAGTAGSAETAKTADRATTAGSATSAGTATRADSAARADSAGQADSAANAANAQALQGMSADDLIAASQIRCPTAMSLAAGVCVDEQLRAPAPLYVAFQDCGEDNLRLPTAGELIAYVNQNADSPEPEWVEPEIIAENQFKGILIDASKEEYNPFIADRSTDHPYRCVTAAAN